MARAGWSNLVRLDVVLKLVVPPSGGSTAVPSEGGNTNGPPRRSRRCLGFCPQPTYNFHESLGVPASARRAERRQPPGRARRRLRADPRDLIRIMPAWESDFPLLLHLRITFPSAACGSAITAIGHRRLRTASA